MLVGWRVGGCWLEGWVLVRGVGGWGMVGCGWGMVLCRLLEWLGMLGWEEWWS